MAVIAVCSWTLLIGASSAYGEQPTVLSVDFGVPGKPALQRASGFLGSISAHEPEEKYLQPLKPRLFRLSPWNALNVELHHRLTALGAVIQCVISDVSGAYGYSPQKWPGDNNDWTEWERVVEEVIKEAQSKGLSMQWDIWNEPDYPPFWDRPAEQFNETWKRAFRIIRTLDPQAIIVGPSLSQGPWHYLYKFLLAAKQNNAVPDMVSWHDYGLDHADDIRNVRAFLKAYGIGDRPISLNEIKSEGQYSPGIIVWWLTHVEEQGADSAAYSCWHDGAGYSNCLSPTLDGLLTLEGQPRAAWFAHREYADISGDLVPVVPVGKSIAGLAGINKELRTAHILLGRRDFPDALEGSEVELALRGLDVSTLTGSEGSIFVRAQRIPDSGTAALPNMIVTLEKEYPVLNGSVQIQLPHFGPGEAYSIHLGHARE